MLYYKGKCEVRCWTDEVLAYRTRYTRMILRKASKRADAMGPRCTLPPESCIIHCASDPLFGIHDVLLIFGLRDGPDLLQGGKTEFDSPACILNVVIH